MPWVAMPGYYLHTGRMSVQALLALQESLRYRDPNAFRTWKFKRGLWDGTHPLHWRTPQGFVVPIGLRHRAEAALREAGVPAILPAPARLPAPLPVTSLPDGTVLYPDQRIALDKALAAQQGLMHLAPNFGKTEFLAAIAHTFQGRRVFILLDGKTLLRRSAERLETLLREPIATLGAGVDRSARPGARILLAMIQSCRVRPQSLEPWLSAEILLIDEAHGITPSWFGVLGGSQAIVRIGMSGTMRDATQPLVKQAFLGPIFHDVTDQDLVKAGRSTPVLVLMPVVEHPSGLSDDYDVLYQQAIVRNKARNILLTQAMLDVRAKGLSVVSLVYLLKHGEFLAARLAQAGGAAEWLHGGTPDFVIDQAMQDFAAGQLGAIIASTIFNKGINLPNMHVLINAAAWKSPLATAQKRGRVARLKPADLPQLAIVIDPYDRGPVRWRCSVHGRIQDDRCCDQATSLRPLLERHARTRKRTYEERGCRVEVGEWAELREKFLMTDVPF